MKTKFQNIDECMHAFAQQNQSEGSSSSVFFYGTKIYSYGYHYLLAEIKETAKGDKYIIIDNRGYSMSTAKHINKIRQATRQYKQLYLKYTDSAKVLYQLEKELLSKLLKAKKPEIYISAANSLFNQYSENCEFIGVKPDKEIVNIYKCFAGANYQEILEKRKKELREKELKEKKQREAQLKINIEKFYNYEIDYIYNTDQDFVRLSIDNTEVETSQRVKVSVKEAKTLYMLIQAGKDIKGFKIGYYTVISINGVLKIGCHNINIESMHRVGKELIK